MIKFFFAFVLVVHGLIHLMGFAKAFQLAELNQLVQSISKPVGIVWLLSTLLFLGSLIFFLLKKDMWWVIGLAAVVLSQIVILASWQDAKWGTIANAVVLVGVILAYGTWTMNTMTRNELKTLLSDSLPARVALTESMISSQPPVVQRWLARSHAVGRDMIQTVHLRQTGQMRTAPGGKWMPVDAEQTFRVDKPGFIWTADVALMPILHLAARDKYQNGTGHMLIKLLSLIPAVDAKGKEIDQGTMLRYLAETIWFPSSALCNYITWEQVDSASAKATMTYGGMTVSGVFSFTEAGDVRSFVTKRYYSRKSQATLETWYIEMDPDGYRDFDGIRVPAKAAVTWKLKDGDFTWLKLEITAMEYNRQ